MSAELLETAEAVVVRPGDTLIIGVSPRTTRAQAEQLKEAIQGRFPQIADVAVIACDQIAVYRPDELKEA